MTQLEFNQILNSIGALSVEQIRRLRGELDAMLEAAPPIDPRDVSKRLNELRALSDGWLDGEGVAPGVVGLNWFEQAFRESYPSELPSPYIYPVAEGGIQLEWPIRPREASLEILFRDHSAEWHCLDLETDEVESQTLNLDDSADWAWLAGRLKALAGAEG